MEVIHTGQSTSTIPEEKLIIPDDNIVRYDIMPNPGDEKITVRVSRVLWFFMYCVSKTRFDICMVERQGLTK